MSAAFYVTTPIYYVNDVPHIGHAYTTLAADTLARWHRLGGADTRLLTGTDEHGLKIEQAARKAGITPQAHADRYSARFRELWPRLGVVPDDFIRTTEPRHEAVVQTMWRRMRERGDIYLGQYEGWYSVGDEAYFDADEITDGRAPSGHTVEWVVEPCYFFRLSAYGPALLEHLRAHPDFVLPRRRYNEIMRFVESGLRDISISRTTFTWGVEAPDAPGHIVYVWLDALTNYISALGGPDTEPFSRYWPTAVHLIGKDILRFHAVYWPCFLLSAGLSLPRHIVAHGWWTTDGEKMSKTRGNVVDPLDISARYGVDAFRYFLLREVTFGEDGDFSERALRDRINGDLANDYGNLLKRTTGMITRYREGVVPPSGPATALEETLIAAYSRARGELSAAMGEFAFSRALMAIWSLVAAANKYCDAAAPWTLFKEGPPERLDAVLYALGEALRIIGIWTLPFLPGKAAELLDRLGVPSGARTLVDAETWGGLVSGTTTRPGEALFPRLEAVGEAGPAVAAATPAPRPSTGSVKKERSKASAPSVTEAPATESAPSATEAPATPATIAYDDFARLDLRVGRIVAAQKHPNADRLLELRVDAGDPEPRTVCAGIASAYAPEGLVGRTVLLLANLAPRKIRGVVSHGMILAAGDGDDIRLVEVPGDPTPGTAVR